MDKFLRLFPKSKESGRGIYSVRGKRLLSYHCAEKKVLIFFVSSKMCTNIALSSFIMSLIKKGGGNGPMKP